MSEMTADFNDRLEAWLADPHAKHLPSEQYTRRPSDGHYAAIAAYEEAHSHTTCSRDTRDLSVLVRVIGADYVDTVVSVDADTTLACFLAALRNTEGIVGIQVLGWDPDEVDAEVEDETVTESEGMVITSEVPGLQATYTPAHLEKTEQPTTLWSRFRTWLRS